VQQQAISDPLRVNKKMNVSALSND